LVGHLQALEKLLKPGGRVILMIPDLRTCFDALRYPAVTADALAAHQRRARVHQGRQVIDSVSREIDKNQGHWMCKADLDDVRFRHDLKSAWDAMTVAEVAGQRYVGLPAWRFTRESSPGHAAQLSPSTRESLERERLALSKALHMR
jgi:hypothetical protein